MLSNAFVREKEALIDISFKIARHFNQDHWLIG